MRDWGLAMVLVLAAVPGVAAGNAQQPEITDPPGDVGLWPAEDVVLAPSGTGDGVDLLGAWIEGETPAGFATVIHVSDLSRASGTGQRFAYSFWFTVNGTQHGYSTFSQRSGDHWSFILGEWEGTTAVGTGEELNGSADLAESTIRVWVPKSLLVPLRSGSSLVRLDAEGSAETTAPTYVQLEDYARAPEGTEYVFQEFPSPSPTASSTGTGSARESPGAGVAVLGLALLMALAVVYPQPKP